MGTSALYHALLISFGIALGTGIAIRDSLGGGLLVGVLWCAFFLPFLIGINLSRSDVIVTDDGISREWYGHRWKHVPWAQISEIWSIRVPSYTRGKMIDSYVVDVSSKKKRLLNKKHPFGRTAVAFDETLIGFSDLLELIRVHTGLVVGAQSRDR